MFEELDTEHQLEFIRTRSDAEAASLLTSMAADDAADLITEVDQERRLPILNLLPESQQRTIRSLLSYHPETAGGLMSPDFVCLPADTSIAGVLDTVRVSPAPAEALHVVFASDREGRVIGWVSLISLLRAAPNAQLDSVMSPDPPHVHSDWDLSATARKMSDFNLTVAPVMDPEHGKILGVVTVDDVLELLLPTGWRRDFGVASPEE